MQKFIGQKASSDGVIRWEFVVLDIYNIPYEVRSVFTIRLKEEYIGMLENISLELKARGIEVKDNVLLKTVLLTGIKDINRMITQGINIFEANEGNEETDD